MNDISFAPLDSSPNNQNALEDDFLIISKNLESMSMSNLELALGVKLTNTLADSGACLLYTSDAADE